jgi:hypothetical protein
MGWSLTSLGSPVVVILHADAALQSPEEHLVEAVVAERDHVDVFPVPLLLAELVDGGSVHLAEEHAAPLAVFVDLAEVFL